MLVGQSLHCFVFQTPHCLLGVRHTDNMFLDQALEKKKTVWQPHSKGFVSVRGNNRYSQGCTMTWRVQAVQTHWWGMKSAEDFSSDVCRVLLP